MQRAIALGLMSGTSMDGVDAALIVTDGDGVEAFGPTAYRPYETSERTILRQALREAVQLEDRTLRPGALGLAEAIVTSVHVEAVAMLIDAHPDWMPDVIGFHGQTVFHAPERGLTVQIGNAAALARRFGVPVVHDFRAADVQAGGEGAPLAPVYHRALVARSGLDLPVGVLNLGGVANLTVIDGRDEGFLAFDTGPANALMDDAVLSATGRPYDEGGMLAAAGRSDAGWLEAALRHPYFAQGLPKSLDRNAFEALPVLDAPIEDIVSTLCDFTAKTIQKAVALVPVKPGKLIAVGGGAHNLELLRRIARDTGIATIPAGDLGWRSDTIEAEAFAYMAVRSLNGLPISFPGTTGAPRPMTGGVVARP
ncbi:MAG: anhydro-N-acetylmuramic acid kinase [Hyphomicrobiaceae bacterium]|nr:anhydro-N-acetylmuramic acid kinase [Hyphomicrobiaceae bacterium]